MKDQYKFSAQMRADLAGGTLDIWPFYLMAQNSVTVQMSLNLSCSCCLTVNKNFDGVILKTESQTFEYSSVKEFLNVKDEKWALLRSVIQYFKPPCGFHLEWFSDSPPGGGLGASSCLAVLWTKCFSEWLGHKFDFFEYLYLCRDLEAQAIGGFAGFQDYIVPLQSLAESLEVKRSINIIYWHPLKPHIVTLNASENLRKHLVLVDTGISHHSGRSNWKGIQSYLEKSDFLSQCRDNALDMADCCTKGNFQKWPALFQREYQLRKTFHKGYIPPEAEGLQKHCFSKAGVKAFKMMGAGGGGCALLWTDNRQQTLRMCSEKNIRILPV